MTNLEEIRLLYSNPMEVFASSLRGMIVSSPGHKLMCADYSAVEARILFWLADHTKGLKIYKENRDPYREMAKEIYNVPLDKVTGEQREVGKRAVLGCGYGMGAKKFEKTCKLFGQEVSKDLAQQAVETYRRVHYPIRKLWYNLENAAIAAVKDPLKKFKINHTRWFMKGDFLKCELPSGRHLSYHKPSIRSIEKWNVKKDTLFFWGVNPTIKTKWAEQHTYGGSLTENVIQAIARDIMADAMLRVDAYGYKILFTVHDEILVEAEEPARLEKFSELINRLPKWAKELPLKSEAWEGKRYRK